MRRYGIAFGGLCAVTTALSPCAVLAQDGGVLMTFGFENRLEAVRNDSLSVPAEGTDVANVTRLSFGLQSETGIDRLTFGATGAAIIENTASDSGTELDFGRAAVTLDYHREVPAAVLDVQAEVRNDDVDAFDDDLDDTDESGTRTDYLLSARIEAGRTSSVGFALGAAYEATDFQDTLDPELDDSTEVRADAAVILHFSEVATGRVGVRYSELEEETPGTTVTTTLVTYAGLDYALSERLDLAAEIGYSDSEVEEFGLIERTTGPDLSLGLTYDMPVGTASALLRVTTDADEGQRETFEIGRSLETPIHTITARLGVTHADPTGTDLIGSLSWDHALPDGAIGLELARSVSFDDDDEESVDSSVSVNWLKNISDVASVSLGLTYEQSDSPSERIEQVTFGAGYNHQLTSDWSLDTGVGYRVRNDADGRSESPNVFVALSREFQIRP
jgi:opacity protein-like surface antigen